jgi:Domain of unknown function (DUF4349)
VILVAEPRQVGCRLSGMETTRYVAGIMICGALLLVGCSGSSNSSGASSASAALPNAANAAGGSAVGGISRSMPVGASKAAGGSGSTGQEGAGTTALMAPAGQIIYTAQLTIRATNVGSATAKASQVAQAAGGYVSSEKTSAGSGATATVQLKIPVTVYPATLGQLESGLGTQLSLQEQAQDVTEQVADVNSQVTSDEAAITQLRALLSHAGSVGGLLSVQNQINNEESSLESMQAQQRALGDQTAYATVTLTILGPKAKPVVHHHRKASGPSLGAGLRSGWHALWVAGSWTLASLGAIAPFAVVLALLGFGGYRARRWIMRRPTTPLDASPGGGQG